MAFVSASKDRAGGDEVRDTRRIPRFPAIRPFRAVSVCVLGGGRGTGEAGEPLQTADEGTTLAGFKYLRGAAPLLDSYGLTWKTTGPDDLVPTPRPMPKVVLVCPRPPSLPPPPPPSAIRNFASPRSPFVFSPFLNCLIDN